LSIVSASAVEEDHDTSIRSRNDLRNRRSRGSGSPTDQIGPGGAGSHLLSLSGPDGGLWLDVGEVALMDEAERPQGLVSFTVVKPWRDLINAVPDAPGK